MGIFSPAGLETLNTVCANYFQEGVHTLSLPRLDQVTRLLSPSPPADVQLFQIELQGRAINAIHL